MRLINCHMLAMFFAINYTYNIYSIPNNKTIIIITRMVQFPATAAIEYVAACWVSGAGGIFVRGSFARGTFSPGVFCPGALLAGGIFVRRCFCPGGLLPGGLLSGGLMPVPPNFNAYTNRLGFLCLAS